MMATLRHLLIKLALCVLPRQRSEWAPAMQAEAECATGNRALMWALGCVWAALTMRLREACKLYAVLSVALVTIFLTIEWNTDEPTISLIALITVTAVLTYTRPERTWTSVLLAGGIPIAAHALANFTWILVPYYQHKPLELWEWPIIAALILPAIVGAYLGRFARELAQ